MQGNKIVYNTVKEILDPSHTTLVVWDVIDGFTRMIFNKEEFSKNLDLVIGLARKSNVPIFFTTNQMLTVPILFKYICS
jgi:nicotinamidase-related amidase